VQNLYQLVKLNILDKQLELDTCCERRHPACEHDTSDREHRLLIKTSQTEKGWIVEKIIVEFPARHMLFALL